MLKSSQLGRVIKHRVNAIDLIVSKNIRIKRLSLGFTQSIVAKALNISVQQVQKYETGINRIASGRLEIMARFFKVPITYFFAEQNCLINQNYSDKENAQILLLIKSFNQSQREKAIAIALVKTMSNIAIDT